MNEKRFYVYMHIQEDTGEPFYIGKGTGQRAFKNGKIRSQFWNNVVNKHGFDIIFLETDLNEEEAFKKEFYWIDRIGRRDLDKGPLVNMTNGGLGGQSGRIPWNKGLKNVLSEESRKKISDGNKGNKKRLGIKHTDEAKLKISETGKGRIPWNKGIPRTEKQNMEHSLKMKGRIPWNKGMKQKK